MKKIIRNLFIAACLMISHSAYASVLDFEDLYAGYDALAQLPAGYGGFTWSSYASSITKYYVRNTYNIDSGYEHGTIGNVSLITSFSEDISMSRTVPFDVIGAYITADYPVDEQIYHLVDIEGWNNGTKIYDVQISTNALGPHWFDFNFDNVDTVWFKPNGWGADIDNITYADPAVPEPTTMALFGLGGLVMALMRRKKKLS